MREDGNGWAQPRPGGRPETGPGASTHAEYVLVRLVGRGLGRSREETPPRSQTLLPSLWKGKVGQTGDLGEWSGGTTGGDVGSDVMAGPAGEPGGLCGSGAGEGLGRPCGQGPAWPCSVASPATGSVCEGEREAQVSATGYSSACGARGGRAVPACSSAAQPQASRPLST